MEDDDESTSENNIIVDGTVDFFASPHDVNKKAYRFRMGKGAKHRYSSRLGFNMYILSKGESTLVIEFFPQPMDEVTVTAFSTSLNIGSQAIRRFDTYS